MAKLKTITTVRDTEEFKKLLFDYKDLIIKFDFLAENNDELKNKLNIAVKALKKIGVECYYLPQTIANDALEELKK